MERNGVHFVAFRVHEGALLRPPLTRSMSPAGGGPGPGQTGWCGDVIDSPASVLPPRSAFAGFRFPAEVIVVAVRWYLRFNLSYRGIEELLAERGVEVHHVSVFRWVHRFASLLVDAARFCRYSPGDRWFVDETTQLPPVLHTGYVGGLRKSATA